MVLVSSYYSKQHWTEKAKSDDEPGEDDENQEVPIDASEYECKSLASVIVVVPDGDFIVFPETGHPGPETTAYILTDLEYDPVTKAVSRKTLTAVRPVADYDDDESLYKALEDANDADQMIWEWLKAETHEWAGTCVEQKNTEALQLSQDELCTEAKERYPNVQLLNTPWERMADLVGDDQ
ncbi:hypothetical protein I350_04439 [Cryptococcus amylolentus CBS 6273]|uniref:Uncharacterized protein n=1 Tax=Cryptococcus amylolentus CBS 6273 TaxID=1296118 RepID=A0A1E3K240_9TREE|nr:hypothetical protein I350_04439 [Cryptococcus amylolentus CBS 6273]